MPGHASTYTVVTCDIVLISKQVGGGEPEIWVQDFSFVTEDLVLPYGVRKRLEAGHVRRFGSMKEFTEFLHEQGAIVEKCYVEVC